MAKTPTIDVEALLNPIGGDDSCGAMSRFDPVFDEIKKARAEENRDAIEGGAVQADWRTVIGRTSDALQNRAKHLMLAAYLTEALCEAEGFAGFRDGLRVVNGLLERFWDGVYPRIEEGDVDRRLAPLLWMTEAERGSRLPNRLRELPIVPPLDGGRGLSLSFSKSTYTQPKGENESDAAYSQRVTESGKRAKLFEDAVAAAPVAVFGALRSDVEECLAEVARFNQVLDERFKASSPSVTSLREALEDCSALATKIFRDKGGLAVEGPGGGIGVGGTEAPPGPEPPPIAGPIGSRDDALRRLGEVAAFFRQTEPHSPIPYLIERAASWGHLTLEQLLQELVKDSTSRDQIAELLGFKRG